MVCLKGTDQYSADLHNPHNCGPYRTVHQIELEALQRTWSAKGTMISSPTCFDTVGSDIPVYKLG
jgi:hypothetical protein